MVWKPQLLLGVVDVRFPQQAAWWDETTRSQITKTLVGSYGLGPVTNSGQPPFALGPGLQPLTFIKAAASPSVFPTTLAWGPQIIVATVPAHMEAELAPLMAELLDVFSTHGALPTDGLERAGFRTQWVDPSWQMDQWRSYLTSLIRSMPSSPWTARQLQVSREADRWHAIGLWAYLLMQETTLRLGDPSQQTFSSTTGLLFDLDMYQEKDDIGSFSATWAEEAWNRSREAVNEWSAFF